MPSDERHDYEVGYGKPPCQTRFRKGQSGNPKGRTAGDKNLSTLLREALNEHVVVTENGRRRKITKRKAILTYQALVRQDFTTFAARCFLELNPMAELAMNGHIEVIAAKLMEVRRGRIRRLIINLPPRHLKSLLGSIALPAWCLGHDPSAQILCVSYGQELADKLARDCRSIMMSQWYRQIFPTRLAPHRHAVASSPARFRLGLF
jgi:hypothetical protein